MDFANILGDLWRSRATGALNLAREGEQKVLFLREGEVIFASSSRPDDRLGEMLLRAGVIGLDTLELAVAELGRGQRLGEILVGRGILRDADLPRVIANQLREVVLSLFSWESGAFRFETGSGPGEQPIELNAGTARLIAEGVRRSRDWRRVRIEAGSLHTRWVATPGAFERPEMQRLAPEEREILDWLRDPLPLGDLCSSVYVQNFEVCRILWALRVLGLAERLDAVSDPAAGIECGRLRTRGFVRLLVALCRRGETGLLHLRRAGEEKIIHLREGQVVFATSSRAEDALTSLLLAKGVIGIREIEGLEKRRLSGKRIGTLLVDSGAMSRGELAGHLKEQLTQVVLSLFSWEDGDYLFEGGGLPTIEPLTVGLSLEDIVLRGVRLVTDWSIVSEGSGGPHARLQLSALSPGLVEVTREDPEVAEVVRALREPASISEICRSRRLHDFRACQIVWGLRDLGAVTLCIGRDAPLDANAEPPGRNRISAALGELTSELEPETIVPVTVDPGAIPVRVESIAPKESAAPADEAPVPMDAPPEATADDPGADDELLLEEHQALPPVTPSQPVSALSGKTAAALAPELFGAAASRDSSAPEPAVRDSAAPDQAAKDSAARDSAARDSVAPDSAVPDSAAPDAAVQAMIPEFPREDVPLLLSGEADGPSEEEPASAGPPPSGSDDLILAAVSGFEERHRGIFETLRSEIGAGAVNYLRRSTGIVPDGVRDALAGVTLLPSGDWDAGDLARRLGDSGPEAGRERLEALLEAELELVRRVIPAAVFDRLKQRLDSISG